MTDIKDQLISASIKGFNEGLAFERARTLKMLKDLGVIRDSMLGPDWYVIYTEHGALDITRSRFEGNE